VIPEEKPGSTLGGGPSIQPGDHDLHPAAKQHARNNTDKPNQSRDH
jgi:hypothetical protein